MHVLITSSKKACIDSTKKHIDVLLEILGSNLFACWQPKKEHKQFRLLNWSKPGVDNTETGYKFLYCRELKYLCSRYRRSRFMSSYVQIYIKRNNDVLRDLRVAIPTVTASILVNYHSLIKNTKIKSNI